MSVQNIQIVVNLGHTEWTTVAPATGAFGFSVNVGPADLHRSVRATLTRMLSDIGLLLVSCDKDGVTGSDEGWFRLSVGAVSLPEIAAALPRGPMSRSMCATSLPSPTIDSPTIKRSIFAMLLNPMRTNQNFKEG
jgi:hypothetical protein